MQDTDAMKPATVPAVGNLEMLLAHSIVRTHNYLGPFIDRSLKELKLHGAQFNVLLLLHGTGDEGLPLGEIGRRLVVTKANVTGLIDRLEHKGFVFRDSRADRRVTVARLTAEGNALVEEILPRHRKLIGELVDCLSDGEKQDLINLLAKLRSGMREKYHGLNETGVLTNKTADTLKN